MATTPKYIRFPFAATGDKEAIPDEAQASGSLSYSEGFGLDYERDPTKDAKAKRMPRGGTNQVLYDATSNIQQYQLYGVPYWYNAASNGGTAIQYQKNAMVRYNDGFNENIYISLKDNNTDIPTVETSWFLFQPYNSTLLSRLSVAPFVPVESMTTAAPPANPIQGKAYLIPSNATGLWAGKGGQLTEWDGSNWLFTFTPNGHSIGLADGRVFTKVNGQYVELLASQNYVNSYVNSYRIPTPQMLNRPFVAIVSITTAAPPAAPNTGAAYIIPPDATGAWAGLSQYLAEWDGTAWRYAAPPNGHSVGLPDGRIFTKVNGEYVEKISLDSQSGKWNYAEAQGAPNALTATLDPKPLALTAGMVLQLKISATNTGPTTLNLNGFGAKTIISNAGGALSGGELINGALCQLVYTGTSWQMAGLSTLQLAPKRSFSYSDGRSTLTIQKGETAISVRLWAGGGGGGGTAGAANAISKGGGGGGYAEGTYYVSEGQVLNITVGSGGKGGFGINNGTSGGASSVGSLISATGGGGGSCSGQGIALGGGIGGCGIGGQLNWNGASSQNGWETSVMNFLAVGGGSFGGGYGALNAGTSNGNTGVSIGQGGNGASGTSGTGGNGQPGMIIIDIY